MYKKAVVVFFSLIGLVSLFLPFSKNVAIGCGDNSSFTNYYYDNLITYLSDFLKISSITYSNAFEFSALIIVTFSLVFSPVLFLLNKKNISLFLIVSTLLLMFIPFYNSYNFLSYGYYIVFLQQTVLLIILSKSNSNNKK